ncbi:MAG: TonB-dependent receptor [Parvibaculum sp.]|jgi:iron complex outermembrane receptor protein|nr:TonB-dependent receptor [Parvibaculum sp.]|tara:strand:+ start:834 stop:2930 length:2097 start_codon:yes stop_codon:yes gene_type:complete
MKYAYNSKCRKSKRRAGATVLTIASLAFPISATAEPVHAPSIVITASPLARTTSELAQPVSIVEKEEISRSGAATLGNLLGAQPGVAQSSFTRGASRPIIRGLDNSRVRIQENGLAAHDVSALSEDHGVPIDPSAAERVEVIRGPAALRYGSEAIGGLVSVLNNRIPDKAPDGGFEAEAEANTTTADSGVMGRGSVDVSEGPIAVHIDAFARSADDYSTPQGTQANSAAEASGLSAGVSYLLPNGHVGVSVTQYNSDYRVPGAKAAANRIAIDLEQMRYAAAARLEDLSGFFTGLSADVGYSDYIHEEVSKVTGTIGSRFDNEEWEGRLELLHRAIGDVEGAWGIQAASRDLSAAGEGGELIAPSTSNRFAAFLFEEWKINPALRLQVSGRIERVELEGLGTTSPTLEGVTLPGQELADFGSRRSLDFTPISSAAALVFDLTDEIALGLNTQYVERAPDLLELFAKGPHEATETFEIGSPTLGKESATSFDLSLTQNTGNLSLEANLFYTSFSDFIFKQNTGFVCGEEFDTCGVEGAPGVEDELTQIAYSQSDADFHGAEFAARWSALDLADGRLGFDGRFDYVRGKLDAGGNVPRITPLRYGAGVFFENDNLFSRISFLRAENQDDVATNETRTNGYVDLRAEATYTFFLPQSDREIELGVVGTNLLDDDIRNHASFKKDDVLEPGTSTLFFIRAKL